MSNLVTGQTLGGLRSDFAGRLGMRFTVGASNLVVSSIGRWIVAGNSAVHPLAIVDVAGSTDLVVANLATAGKTAGAFAYTSLRTYIPLLAGQTYDLMSGETVGGDQWYDDMAVSVSADFASHSSAYQSGGTDSVSFSNHTYVPVDLTYTVGDLPAAPAAPSSLTVTGTTSTTASLSWSVNSNDQNGFDVQYASDNAFTSPVTLDIAGSDATSDSIVLGSGQTYYLRVRAYNGGGASAWSNTVSVTPGDAQEMPADPTIVYVSNIISVTVGVTVSNAFESYGPDISAGTVAFAANGATFTGTHTTPTPSTLRVPYTFVPVAGDTSVTLTYAGGTKAVVHRYVAGVGATVSGDAPTANENAAAVKAALAGATITVASPLIEGDVLTIVAGDDYTGANTIPLTVLNWPGASVNGQAAELRIADGDEYDTGADRPNALALGTGTISQSGSTLTIPITLTSAASEELDRLDVDEPGVIVHKALLLIPSPKQTIARFKVKVQRAIDPVAS